MNFTSQQLKEALLKSLPEDRRKLLSDRTINENVESLYSLVTEETTLEDFVSKTKNNFNSFAGQILQLNRDNALAIDKAKEDAKKNLETNKPEPMKTEPNAPQSKDPIVLALQKQIAEMEKASNAILEKMSMQETMSLVESKKASFRKRLEDAKINKDIIDSILPLVTASINKDTNIDELYSTTEPMLNKFIAKGDSSLGTSSKAFKEIPKEDVVKAMKQATSPTCNDF